MAKQAKVETAEKRFLVKEVGGSSVKFVLANGLGLTVELGNLGSEIVQRLALHGLSQKIGDSAAGFSKEKRYGDALAAMQDVADMLGEGKWAAGSGGGTSDLVEALSRLKGVEKETVRALVKRASEEKVKEWLGNKAVKAAILEIKLERIRRDEGRDEDEGEDLDLDLE